MSDDEKSRFSAKLPETGSCRFKGYFYCFTKKNDNDRIFLDILLWEEEAHCHGKFISGFVSGFFLRQGKNGTDTEKNEDA